MNYILLKTAFYFSEIAMNQPYGFEVDVYGLGCILYSMLFGTAPAKRDGSRFDVQIPNGISVEAENLLKNLLCKDGRRRMALKCKSFFKLIIQWTILF